MPVILRHRGELKRLPKFRYWFCTEDINISNTDIFFGADPLPNIPRRLEESFESVMAEWWDLGKSLGRAPTGRWSHTTACNPNASELGSCLAWTRIVEECATHLDVTLVVCGDPWLYRHLSGLQGVKAGSAPCLWWAPLGYIAIPAVCSVAASANGTSLSPPPPPRATAVGGGNP